VDAQRVKVEVAGSSLVSGPPSSSEESQGSAPIAGGDSGAVCGGGGSGDAGGGAVAGLGICPLGAMNDGALNCRGFAFGVQGSDLTRCVVVFLCPLRLKLPLA
jgi:hypothetical protein